MASAHTSPFDGRWRHRRATLPPITARSNEIGTRTPSSVYSPHKTLMGDRLGLRGDILKGTLDVLILKSVVRGPRHGYAIAEAIQQTSDEVLRVEEGALYPALHRLELRGLLKAEWGVSGNNRRAKFYRLTAAGRRRLAEDMSNWQRLSLAVTQVLESA